MQKQIKTATYTLKAPAKINLFLHLNGKLDNGYNDIVSFIVFINLVDRITASLSDKYSLQSSGSLKQYLPAPENNLITKVALFVQKKFEIQNSVSIQLEKNIPVAAGLAGGSTDVAAILQMLNNLWNLKLSTKKLAELAVNFGADIPSCIYQQSGFIENIGDKITPFSLPFTLPILLISSLKPVSTSLVYKSVKQPIKPKLAVKNTIPTGNLLSKHSFLQFIKHQTNDLTESATQILPEILLNLNLLKTTNPIVYRMSGSGSSCFAIYDSKEELQKAYKYVKNKLPNNFIFCGNNISNS